MTSLPLDDACLISESLAEPKIIEPQQLKGFAIYHIPKDARTKNILKRDPSLVHLIHGLFASKNINGSISPPAVSNTPGILTLVPRRDTTKPLHIKQVSKQYWRRRFVLIIYRPFKTETLRKQFSRVLERTPVIRVRPGLLLAPQIPNSRYSRYTTVLQRPSHLLAKLIEWGSPVWFVPRVELMHLKAFEIVNTLVWNTLAPRTNRIIQMCKRMHEELKRTPPTPDIFTQFHKQLQRIRRRIRNLRWQIRFFRTEFGIDFQVFSNRVLSAASRVQQLVKKMWRYIKPAISPLLTKKPLITLSFINILIIFLYTTKRAIIFC